jgi:non-heme chloroperoxidase
MDGSPAGLFTCRQLPYREGNTKMNRRTALTLGAIAGATIATATDLAARAQDSQSAGRSPRPAADAGAASSGRSPRTSFIVGSDGTELFCRSWGIGRPVVFLHSWALNSEMWGYQMLPLVRAGFRCIAFDRRGHGRSGDSGGGYDFDTLADDLAAVLDSLDLHNGTLVAHSMGCGEVTRYLTRHGSRRVAGIALLAPTGPFLLKTADNPDGIEGATFAAVRAGWMHDFQRWVVDNTPPFFTSETSPHIARWVGDMMSRTSLQAAIECNVSVAETDFRPELPRIKTRTLIIHGTADVSAPLRMTGQRMAQLIPSSEFKVYEGAPHGLFITHADRITADLLQFVQG